MDKVKTTTSCTIYPSDLVLVREWKEELLSRNKEDAKNHGGWYQIPNMADVLKICIEYSRSRGVFK